METLVLLISTIVVLVVVLLKIAIGAAKREERYERRIHYLINQINALEQARAIRNSYNNGGADAERMRDTFDRASKS